MFHLRERDRVTWLKPCLAPWRRHMSTIFWGLVSSQKVLMELCSGICTCRRSCSREGECRGGGREKRDLFECQADERRHGVRQQNSFFSLLILPCQHTQIQTQIVSFSSRDVLCKLEIGLGVWWLNSRVPILNCASSFNRHNTYCYRMQFSFLHLLGSTTVFFFFFSNFRYAPQIKYSSKYLTGGTFTTDCQPFYQSNII